MVKGEKERTLRMSTLNILITLMSVALMSISLTYSYLPSLVAFPANTSDYKTVDATLLQRLCPTPRPCPLYADKGYDSKKVRHDLSHAGYIARVSQRRVSVHRVVNQRRGVVERFFSWLDKNRRLIVRYDAYIASYMSWTWLASCKILGKRM